MRTIALRFGETFSPPEGTIAAHQQLIDKNGFVWYGKLGNRISHKVAQQVMDCDTPRILLIRSGRFERYWAYVEEISFDKPDNNLIPAYYRDLSKTFGCWFRIKSFEKAENGVMSKCIVPSSHSSLSEASKYSMSPYFIIEYGSEDDKQSK